MIVRVRPLDPCDSSEQDNSSCLDVTSDHVSITVHREPDHTDKMFTFDHVTGDRTTQVICASVSDMFLYVFCKYTCIMELCDMYAQCHVQFRWL